jgi:ABC-type multidrug transport system ATPase subunit
VLSIRDLSKTYPGGVRALRNVSLDIPPGMFGLIGPNGAGKSTLMKILATLLDPDCGQAHLDSLDLIANKDATRRLLGYLPQEFGVYPKMSAYDLLNHLAVMKGILSRGERKELVEGLLHQTNLWEFRKRALGTYSGGMKQRFGIAQALLANPHHRRRADGGSGPHRTEPVSQFAERHRAQCGGDPLHAYCR